MKSLPVSSSPRARKQTRLCGIALVPSALALTLAALALPATAQTSVDRATAAPAQPAPQISAPVPVAEQASLTNDSNSPFSDSSSPFAAGQQSAPAQTFTAPAHTQGPHHTLGKTMAIVGTIALGFGALSYAVADEHCKNFNGICGDLHTGGLVTMSAGGAAAAVGFYWDFQKPKQ
jgi:hypothetical protein